MQPQQTPYHHAQRTHNMYWKIQNLCTPFFINTLLKREEGSSRDFQVINYNALRVVEFYFYTFTPYSDTSPVEIPMQGLEKCECEESQIEFPAVCFFMIKQLFLLSIPLGRK